MSIGQIEEDIELIADDFEDLVEGFEGLDDDDDEFFLSNDGGDAEEDEFDVIIGKLEDILMDDAFVRTQNQFLAKHCGVFEDNEENKLEYTSLFEEYNQLVEQYLERRLTEEIPNFSMDKLARLLETRTKEELEGDVFDLLLTISDFISFRELMIDYKKGRNIAPDSGFCISCRPVDIHSDEQEDGIARPDLNLLLDVKPLKSPTKAHH
eukprot:TRINITY_DN6655_c0_g1::TRINITY_DN6655_c0_g1_i1::g.20285::m.20285 TRINITY_DN6655_c0_g1::TRINITY_DN6655_c0_g1_i1::g.20285  ORF type:complete len:209 (-),score=43.90,sp/Q5ZKW5/AR2BP_CHICK/44.96/5e-32,ARL2_Bind_BART/PF11527.3/5.4e-27 TRINITY_DN6655_c0_g1_i1:540-1166(-)